MRSGVTAAGDARPWAPGVRAAVAEYSGHARRASVWGLAAVVGLVVLQLHGIAGRSSGLAPGAGATIAVVVVMSRPWRAAGRADLWCGYIEPLFVHAGGCVVGWLLALTLAPLFAGRGAISYEAHWVIVLFALGSVGTITWVDMGLRRFRSAGTGEGHEPR